MILLSRSGSYGFLLTSARTKKASSRSYGFCGADGTASSQARQPDGSALLRHQCLAAPPFPKNRRFSGAPEGGFESDVRTQKSLEPKLKAFAVRTGLEPATSGVTGRYSNQLNYRTRVVRTSFSKASAKVLLFFELTKFFGRKMQKNMHFFDFCFVFEYYTMQIWRFLYFSMLQTLFSEKPLIGRKKSSCSCRMMAPSSC